MNKATLRAPGRAFLIAIVATAMAVMTPRDSRAQNLIQNPGFTDGSLTGYTTTGGVTAESYTGGSYIAFFANAESSLSQTITTIPNAVYTFTFMAAFDPGIADTALASFGTGSLPFSFASGQATGSAAQYSFSGTATGTSTTLSFSNLTGESYITALDLEAGGVQGAPAPTAGAGALSVIAGFAMMFGRRLLRRRIALQ